ncbi:DUF488 domain-containing protein [Roseiarcaceae bacterium H3SJ34-1]|uniref:DUF488 domain-containing protein n=1 Tax=Terripilifer ovatus TaxID=3032367 RepID=UPI003AB943C9|nr:DUF488 domain-containing protein [Roseiarcaceae bacterium H3SJ34-1]
MKIKRIYDAPAKTDGTRVLVDRVWPRGMTKEHAAVDLWLKEIAPSATLRKWFAHDAKRWAEFQSRYRAELDANAAVVQQLRDLAAKEKITLLYSAHDTEHNNAVALSGYLAGGRLTR